MSDATDHRDGRLDLVPMIDCIMLLLLFFLLTTRFVSEEQAIASLLPTTKGCAATSATIDPPPIANICIYPAGLERGLRPAQYADRLRELGGAPTAAWLRIGSAEPMAIDVAALHGHAGEASGALAAVHAYIADQLSRREASGARREQCPVTIHCFSGLPWAYALAAYDACRAYEAGQASIASRDLAEAREVDFAPPRVRDSSRRGLGEELFEIIQLR